MTASKHEHTAEFKEEAFSTGHLRLKDVPEGVELSLSV